jgi:hypothetical protein
MKAPAKKILFAVLGWEDRAREGFFQNITNHNFSEVFLICYSDYQKYTSKNLASINEFCSSRNIKLNLVGLTYSDAVTNWKYLSEFIGKLKINDCEITIDITTSPRELIWTLLSFITLKSKKISYIYYKPKEYSKDWLSKEPDSPRLLLKHSGITRFGKSTALVVITGFDTDRIKHLVHYFEPRITYLGIQSGDQFDNHKRNNLEAHLAECRSLTEFHNFELDSYTTDCGYSKIQPVIESLQGRNIVVSSLGPKPSALALYKCHLDNPDIALSYVPCIKYNPHYSTGLGLFKTLSAATKSQFK